MEPPLFPGFQPRRGGRFTLAVCACLVAGLGRAEAQVPAPPAVLFVAHTVEGVLAPAEVVAIGADWSIELSGSAPRRLNATDWILLRRHGLVAVPFPTKNVALLTTGDRLILEPGAPFRLDEERIFLHTPDAKEIGVPRALFSYLCFRPPAGTLEPARFLARVAGAKRGRDSLYLMGGDRVEGALVVPARGPSYAMDSGMRSVNVPLDQIAVVALNTELQARPRTKKPFVHVITTNGARLQFGSLKLDARQGLLSGKTLFGAAMEVRLDAVAVMSMRQGQAVYLSDLTPINYQAMPFLGVKWPLAHDAAVEGGQLSLGEAYFDKGLGMHAPCQVTFALDGNYRWFEATVGLEDMPGKLADVKISIALDEAVPVLRKELGGGGPPTPIRVEVSNARKMTLVVESGPFGDVQGRVNWCDARLIRAKK